MTIQTPETTSLPMLEVNSPHIVKFYDGEDDLFSMVGDFLGEGSDPIVIIARPERRERFAAMLRLRGADPEALSDAGRLIFLDAHETLAAFMTDSMPDDVRFSEHVGGLIRDTTRQHGRVRAYGEMVDILWQSGNPEATVRLEELWNDLVRKETFSLFCAYPIGNFLKETDRAHFDSVCSAHTLVHAAARTSLINDESRALAALQQRTLALETEVRQRIELEKSLCHALAARRETEEELRRLYELAQESNRTKDQFLATLSHELRTPLTAILGWARMLTLGGMDAETTRTAIETIERSARIQASIVDDLLDLSKIVTGKLAAEREVVDLDAVVDEAVQTCALAAEAKKIEVEIRRPEQRALVMGDPTRLRQIVWNLFSNAIKYSPNGGHISLAVARAGRSATITIQDDGRGITPDFLTHMFEPFRQADGSSTRGHGGLGLGLTIVKHLTEMHGGTVEARSDGEGRGATFIVTLPLVQSDPMAAASVPGENIDLRGSRILVVDDDEPTGDLLRAMLTRFGAEVEVERSLRTALARAATFDPHAVITDIALGDDDGFSLFASIRSACDVPVMAVTALSEPATEERVMAAGFDAYVRKPVDPLELARRVAELVNHDDGTAPIN